MVVGLYGDLKMRGVCISGKLCGKIHPTFIRAAARVSHCNGKFKLAKELVDTIV